MNVKASSFGQPLTDLVSSSRLIPADSLVTPQESDDDDDTWKHAQVSSEKYNDLAVRETDLKGKIDDQVQNEIPN